MVTFASALAAVLLFSADPPTVGIRNGQIEAKIYLPDPVNGFYRSTRFDWSGAIGSIKYRGHDFYGPWFYRIDPAVYDLGYDEKGVISAPFTAMVGPVEEFGTDDRYDHSRTYTLVDPGKWTVKKSRDSVEFTQVLDDAVDGYAYIYRKVIRLLPGKPQMVIEQSLKNTGKHPIHSTVYDHNFLVLDGEGPSQDLTITVPFPIESPRPATAGLLEVRGNQLVYVKTLENEDQVDAEVGLWFSGRDRAVRGDCGGWPCLCQFECRLRIFAGRRDRMRALVLPFGNGLVALNLADGVEKWFVPLKTPEAMAQHRGVVAAVSVIPGAFFSGGMDGILRAVSPGNGQPLWEFDTAREFETVNGVKAKGGSIGAAGPVIANGMVFVGSGYVGFQNGVPGNVLLAFAPSFSLK